MFFLNIEMRLKSDKAFDLHSMIISVVNYIM